MKNLNKLSWKVVINKKKKQKKMKRNYYIYVLKIFINKKDK